MLKEKIKVINVRLMLSGFRKDLKCGWQSQKWSVLRRAPWSAWIMDSKLHVWPAWNENMVIYNWEMIGRGHCSSSYLHSYPLSNHIVTDWRSVYQNSTGTRCMIECLSKSECHWTNVWTLIWVINDLHDRDHNVSAKWNVYLYRCGLKEKHGITSDQYKSHCSSNVSVQIYWISWYPCWSSVGVETASCCTYAIGHEQEWADSR